MYDEQNFSEIIISTTIGIFITALSIMILITCYQSFYPEKYNLKTNKIQIEKKGE